MARYQHPRTRFARRSGSPTFTSSTIAFPGQDDIAPYAKRLRGVPLLRTELIEELDRLILFEQPWRELAHTCSCPAALPGWQLAWWRHVAPKGALLRAVAVFENDDRLVGLAPFFVNPGRRVDYRLLGAGITHRLSPLAAPGREREIAALVGRTLADSSPRPDLIAFEGIDATSPWPQIFVESWPGRFKPWRYSASTHPAPVLELEGSFEEWLASRSRKLREELRRTSRHLESNDGTILMAQGDVAVREALEAFIRLYASRWERNRSGFGQEIEEMLIDATRSLAARGEIDIWTLRADGQIRGVNIVLTAGGELMGFRSAFDPRLSKLGPGLLMLRTVIEEAFASGARRLDLGVGAEPYKLRLATGDAPITWTGIVPRTRRYPLTQSRLTRDRIRWLRNRLVKRLPDKTRARLKRVLRRQ